MKNELQKRILSSLVLIPMALFFIVKGSLLFNFFTLLCFIVTSYEWHIISKKKSYFFPGFIFIIFSFYTFFFFRNEIYMNFLLILLTCISTDIGGYVFGKILKGPRLTKISPNKTYSGMFGGFLLALVSANIYLNNLKFLLIGDNIKMEIMLFITVLLIKHSIKYYNFNMLIIILDIKFNLHIIIRV